MAQPDVLDRIDTDGSSSFSPWCRRLRRFRAEFSSEYLREGGGGFVRG